MITRPRRANEWQGSTPNHSTIANLVDLNGKRALLTGGSKGIGAACARRLAEAGAHITIADLDPAGADLAAEVNGEFVTCDITDATQLEQAVDRDAGNDRLDILINNAGIYCMDGVAHRHAVGSTHRSIHSQLAANQLGEVSQPLLEIIWLIDRCPIGARSQARGHSQGVGDQHEIVDAPSAPSKS